MGQLDSEDYIAMVVDEYRRSSAFEDEVYQQASSFYNRGCAHVLYSLHHLVPDKALLSRIFMSSYVNPYFRSGCDFVPYTKSELAEIASYDEKEGRHWSPPALACPTLEELCKVLRAKREVAATEATPDF